MTVEDRLRQAMRADTDRLEVDPQAWNRVKSRVARRRATRAVGASLLGAAALFAAVLGIAALLADGDAERVLVVPRANEGSTSTTEPSTSTTVLPAEEDGALFGGIWPFTSQEDVEAYVADPGVGMFFDPEATALEFAREYLGMPEPVIAQGFIAEGNSGFVHVVSRPGSPMVTSVWVHRFGGADGAYSVYDAYTDNIQVDQPESMHVVGTNIVLSGTSTAFEANVSVEVRQDVQPRGEHLGRSYVMGGANGEMAPFAGDITIDPPTAVAGAVIFTTESMEDGTVQEATVVRIVFDQAQESGGLLRFSVFFHRGEELVEVGRESGRTTTGVLRAALDALFQGPMPDQDGEELSSFFSSETADLLSGVNLRPDGTAVVDIADTVNNASTSAGSLHFLEELGATVFQFSTVERIEYRLGGSCDAFWTWLQYGDCRLVERPTR